MITIVYASRATQEMDAQALSGLLDVARTRNGSEGVTGMLIYAYGSFMQQLEGEEGAVDRIFASIEADSRHTQLRLLARRPISERRYSGWAMGFEHPDAETLAARLPGYQATMSQPLVSSDLIHNTEMAEYLLGAMAGAQAGDAPS